MRIHVALSTALIGCATLAFAHPPDEFDSTQSRIWVSTRSGECIEGSFLFSRSGIVAIATPSGELRTLELAELAGSDRVEADARIARIVATNEARAEQAATAVKPPQALSFERFAPFVKTRFDDRWLYVESDGLPHAPLEMKMMVGITAWQQQVPLPQNYVGANAWQIPLKPELADKPVLGKENLMRGAVAIAANGIPIFNALNNRGVDSFSIGELDEFGGHCGRGDDYHYHAAPLVLETVVGTGNPIAYALDGFPIYGLFDPRAQASDALSCPCGSHDALDELNGHFCDVPKGQGFGAGTRSYHYHASKKFPYINGGLRGKVALSGPGPENEVVPQAHAMPVRPALQALRGAKITAFERVGLRAWSLGYEIGEKHCVVNYRVSDTGTVTFEFVDADGSTRVEEHTPRSSRGDGAPPRAGRNSPRIRGGERDGARRGSEEIQRDPPPQLGFRLRCDGVGDDGQLLSRHTCDGESVMPGFTWSNLPPGTKSVALTMHHITPDDTPRVYLVYYGIPPNVLSIDEGAPTAGRFGLNSVTRRMEYAAPCSQGPGEKTYVATIYAMSAEPALASRDGVTRELLLEVMKPLILGTASTELTYIRRSDAATKSPTPPPAREGNGARGVRERMTSFKTDVPVSRFESILAQPTKTGMTVSVRASSACFGAIEFGRTGASETTVTPRSRMQAGTPVHFALTGLSPAESYTYRFVSWGDADEEPTWSDARRFHTPRARSSPFAFVIQADSHLDQAVTTKVYEQTLANMVAEAPDFLVDLGDTFMTDKRGKEYERSLPQYDGQRYYFGLACHSMPLFMVLGNHDGESGHAEGGIAAWAYRERTARFPAPKIDGTMFSGLTDMSNDRGANYYAFEWGDALLIVLDPFWPTTQRRGGGGGGDGGGPNSQKLEPIESSWDRTIGQAQYVWLAQTLERSTAKQKFVFIHHLVGGVGGQAARGGVESARYFEWGGDNADGKNAFAQQRPGWPMPIHQLLVKNGVTAVSHGHDHLYAHSMLDGIHYQCVPQPGNLDGNTRSAEVYGYASGTLFGSPGHVRVSMQTNGSARVEFVRTAVPEESMASRRGGASGRRGGQSVGTTSSEANGAIIDSYEINPRPSSK